MAGRLPGFGSHGAGGDMTMTFGSLFAGIGGFDLGLERAGMVCKWQVEIDANARLILANHWPNVRRFEDVREVGEHNLEPVDLICGGFPCQDVSLIGQRAGFEGKRSTLWSEFARIICEIKPRFVVAENVRGLFTSDSGQFFGNILRDLAQLGYDAEWDCLPAAFFGAPQLRHRVYIIAYPAGYLRGSSRLPHIFTSNRTHLGEHLRPSRKITWNGIQIDRKNPTSYIENFSKPIFLRMADGIPGELDKNTAAIRMKRCGNAVVPQVVEWIGRRILDAQGCSNA